MQLKLSRRTHAAHVFSRNKQMQQFSYDATSPDVLLKSGRKARLAPKSSSMHRHLRKEWDESVWQNNNVGTRPHYSLQKGTQKVLKRYQKGAKRILNRYRKGAQKYQEVAPKCEVGLRTDQSGEQQSWQQTPSLSPPLLLLPASLCTVLILLILRKTLAYSKVNCSVQRRTAYSC